MAPIRNWEKGGRRKEEISPRRDGTSAFARWDYGVTGKAQRHKGTKGEKARGGAPIKAEG